MKKTLNLLFIAAGCLAVALGTVGVFLPFLPSTPFFLLAVLCFAKGSQKLHDRFVATKLYKKHIESFAKRRAMTRGGKCSVIASVTILMGVGFWLMDEVPVGRAVLAAVWAFHIWYFLFRVKTEPRQDAGQENAGGRGTS
ncbi:MAG: YbaN family protein [Clostridiales Family XIII bacterium]|nr:YbaN family protein [Clostridiales Family XIII bacterium]